MIHQNIELRFVHFNSQPHEEADQLPLQSRQYQVYFNSQPHEEADNLTDDESTENNVFQLTASRGG